MHNHVNQPKEMNIHNIDNINPSLNTRVSIQVIKDTIPKNLERHNHVPPQIYKEIANTKQDCNYKTLEHK